MNNEQFHAERLIGLGGSDIGAILGLNPYRTAYDVWMEKTGRAPDDTDSLPLRFGRFAESFVAAEYERETGRKTAVYEPMLRHLSAPLVGHVDRLVLQTGMRVAFDEHGPLTDTGLECKAVTAYALGRGSDWGEPGTDQVPESYLVQCAVYMALTGCQYWDLAALFGGSQELRVYRLRRDLELEGMILEESARWWTDHVVGGAPPNPRSEAEARQRWAKHTDGRVLEADDNVRTMIATLANIKGGIKALEKDEQSVRDALIPVIADADTVTYGGAKLLTFRANKDSEKTDWEALARELLTDHVTDQKAAEIIAAHTTTKPGPRVLRLGKE